MYTDIQLVYANQYIGNKRQYLTANCTYSLPSEMNTSIIMLQFKLGHHFYHLTLSNCLTWIRVNVNKFWLSHIGSFKCTTRCDLSPNFVEKHLVHMLHLKGFSPVCVLRWFCSFQLSVNSFSQNSHWCTFLSRPSANVTENMK